MYDSCDVKSKLRKSGYRLTSQRENLIEILCEEPDYLFSLNDIYSKVKSHYKDTTYSTVYRNIEVLEQAGIIKKVVASRKAVKYKLECCSEHHHHVICKKCGRTATVDFCPAEFISTLSDSETFIITDHVFEMYGYCRKCFKNLSRKDNI
ncbi:MAG: Fur family transcriptional regulator [Clostridia bacterium]|nr:Fur family transcriptional regulator [Clostridia bacterium]